MGAFKIQTDLDLSGFNLLNFCIQSYTDLENVPNLGLGRKLFFTGNSTDEKNLREVIWDGVEWKAAAYLDDIEAITNGEGSLGTRVKTLEDMLKVDDTKDVINTWAEIQAFLDQVQEGTDLMTMLDGKLDKKGGVMTFNSVNSLIIRKTTNNLALIRFDGFINSANTPMGYLGFYGVNNPVFYDTTTKPFALLHAGNFASLIGDTYLKTTGGTITGNLTINQRLNMGSYIRFNQYDEEAEYMLGMTYAGGPLGWYNGSAWKTIAFTDSNITGNAATATKLKNSVSLWGNSFDGTQSLDEDMKFANNTAFFIQTSDKTAYRNLFYYDTSNTLYIGRDAGENGERVAILGSPLTFGTSRASTAMTITKAGNVLVGSNNNILSAKFKSTGLTHVAGASSAPVLGNVVKIGLAIGSDEYGMQQWVEGSGQGNIQVGRFDGTATAYALNLNPLDGAVNIASADAYTNVLGHLFASKDLYMGGLLFMNHGEEGIYLLGSGISWHNTNDLWSASLLTFAKDSIKVHQLANFTSRVLIGGAEDDGNYKLQVFGGIKAYSPEGHAARLNNGNVSLSLIGSTTTNAVAKGLYFNFDGTYVGGLVALHSKGAFQYLYLGDNPTTPWFSINSTESNFNVLTKFNAGALIPTGQKMTFGADGPTMEYDADANAIKVTGNIYATGTVASGGKAAEGEGDNGGGGNANVYSDVLEGVITQEWEVGNPFQKEDVIVSLYMWNTDESRWKMFLADIGVTSENIWVTFGRPTSTTDKFMAVVMG